jgi:hypothetical protein
MVVAAGRSARRLLSCTQLHKSRRRSATVSRREKRYGTYYARARGRGSWHLYEAWLWLQCDGSSFGLSATGQYFSLRINQPPSNLSRVLFSPNKSAPARRIGRKSPPAKRIGRKSSVRGQVGKKIFVGSADAYARSNSKQQYVCTLQYVVH